MPEPTNPEIVEELRRLRDDNGRLRAALRAAGPTLRAVGDRTVQRLCREAMPDEFPARAVAHEGGPR